LDEKGRPTPLAATYMRAPLTRMDILTPQEIDNVINNSEIIKKYNQSIDPESAYEILKEKIEESQKPEHQEKLEKETVMQGPKRKKSTFEKLTKNTMVRQLGRTVARELTRGLLGALGVSTTTRRRRRYY